MWNYSQNLPVKAAVPGWPLLERGGRSDPKDSPASAYTNTPEHVLGMSCSPSELGVPLKSRETEAQSNEANPK